MGASRLVHTNKNAVIEHPNGTRLTLSPPRSSLYFCVCVAAWNRRLVDGWINERRKGTDDAGLLFAIRVGDHRAAAFVRQITAALVMLPAFCSNNSRVRTTAATWLAANAAQSAIAAAALMEDVDEALVETAVKQCPCCYCSTRNSGTESEARKAVYASSVLDDNSQRHPDDREASAHSEKLSVALQDEGSEAGDGVPSGEAHPVAGGVAPPDVPCRLRPLAAKDLLLAESPVIEPSLSQASALPCTLPPIVDGHMLRPPESGESLDGLASSQLLASYNGCTGGWWHRDKSCLEKCTNLNPADVSEVWYSANGREKGVDGLWNILLSLVKVRLLHVTCVRLEVCFGMRLFSFACTAESYRRRFRM